MNKFLAIVCCLASLASARPDGYNYNPRFSGGSSFVSGPVTSYIPAASGEDGVSVGFDSGSASSGSLNFLSPGYNVGSIQSGGSGFSSSGGLSSSGGFSSGGSLLGGGGSGGLVSSGGLGYNTGNVRYGGGSLGLSSFGSGGSLGGASLGGASLGGASLGGGSLGGASLGGGLGISQGYSSGGSSFSGAGLGQQQQYAPQFQAPLITKSFYVHSAPEDHDEQQIVRYVTIGRPLKNYRVVFINAPSSTSTKAKIIAQVAPVEDKTAIYVLSKKSNDLDISADVVSPPQAAPAKPDVFFIKYKSPAEAQHAQQVIQAQYDQLGGTSSFSNEGVIPVQSVIGSLGESDASASANSQGSAQLDFSGISGGSGFGTSNIAPTPVVGSGAGQTNVNIGTVSKPLLVPAGQSSGGNFISSGNLVTTPLVLSSGGSSGSSSSSSFGGLADQSQFDQVSGGSLTQYLPPGKYKRY